MARKAVQDQLRAQGLRLSRLKAADIAAMAQAYLEDHPQLYWDALDRACKLGLVDPSDRDRFLDLLNITKYFVRPVRGTEDGKRGTESIEEIQPTNG
jgi:hypothetical protein